MPKMWAKHDTREKKRDNKMGMQPNMLLRFQFLPKSKCGKSGDFEIGLWSLAGTGFETGATERALSGTCKDDIAGRLLLLLNSMAL